MLIVVAADFFMIWHCCRLWHSATHDMTCSSGRTRTGRRLAVLPLLELKKLGRRDAHRWHIAPCTGTLSLAWIFYCVQAANAYPNLNPHAFQRHGARQWSWGSACAAARPLVRPIPVVGRVLVPRAYLVRVPVRGTA